MIFFRKANGSATSVFSATCAVKRSPYGRPSHVHLFPLHVFICRALFLSLFPWHVFRQGLCLARSPWPSQGCGVPHSLADLPFPRPLLPADFTFDVALKPGCGFYLSSFLQGSKRLSRRGARPDPSSTAYLSGPCACTGPHSGGAGGLRRWASVPGHSSPLIIKQASPDVGGSHRIRRGNGPILGRPERHLSWYSQIPNYLLSRKSACGDHFLPLIGAIACAGTFGGPDIRVLPGAPIGDMRPRPPVSRAQRSTNPRSAGLTEVASCSPH